jgi:uncharacterized protein with PIN domain
LKRASFRFYAELNDFLPDAARGSTLSLTFHVPPSVKDAIESFGVPHTEVDLVVAGGESVDLSYRLRDGELVSVYPMFESLDIRAATRVRALPLRETRFVVDENLGALARYLRLLGLDVAYDPGTSDPDLARISNRERRVLLTRDVGLLKRSEVTHGYFVRATDPKEQTVEVVRRFDLVGSLQPLERCTHCNAQLKREKTEGIEGRVPPGTLERGRDFRSCPACRRIYWRGAHYPRIAALIERVKSEAARQSPPD